VGLPIPAVLKNTTNAKFDEDFNKRLQELAWKTVINYPLSGVKAPAEKKVSVHANIRACDLRGHAQVGTT
jgi:hypothetical protein